MHSPIQLHTNFLIYYYSICTQNLTFPSILPPFIPPPYLAPFFLSARISTSLPFPLLSSSLYFSFPISFISPFYLSLSSASFPTFFLLPMVSLYTSSIPLSHLVPPSFLLSPFLKFCFSLFNSFIPPLFPFLPLSLLLYCPCSV